MASINPLIVIVGETASGKTALGIELAQKINGEIICADSRTIYREMDIGTAKPTNAEQALIPHHLLDIRNPDETYSVAEFQQDAKNAIDDIADRGKIPILVGGSGLYVDSVIYDYSFSKAGRRDSQNRRHLAPGTGPSNKTLRANTLIIGLQRSKDDLEARIQKRAKTMLAAGLIEEVRSVVGKYGRNNPAFNGICYQFIADHLDGKLGLDEAIQKFVRGDVLLAKKQRTWFKRNKSIQWLTDPSKAVAITTTFLNNLPK